MATKTSKPSRQPPSAGAVRATAAYSPGDPPASNGSHVGHVPADLAAAYAAGLVPIVPDFLAREGGDFLGYRGQMHWLQGEPESGKSWLAILPCVQVIADGGRATYIDYETSVTRFLLRLQDLGLPEKDVIRGLTYVNPAGSVRPHLDHYADLFDGRDVVAIDACTGSMAAENLNPDKALEVAAWAGMLPRIALDAGAAVFVVDHVVKSREDRGRWATGSGHKLALTDVAFSVTAVHLEPFARGKRGRAWINVQKDRDGGLRALTEPGSNTVADLVLDSTVSPAVLALTPPSEAPVKQSNADRIYALVPEVPDTIRVEVIAEQTGLAEKTVKNILSDALKNLVHNVNPKRNLPGEWQRLE